MSTAQSLGAGGSTLAVLALLCWFLMVVNLVNVVGKQVHGDAVVGHAMAWLAAIGLGALTWLWTGGLLMKAGSDNLLPGWRQATALIVYCCSAAAAAAALYVLQDPTRVWPVLVPALIPPILTFYVLGLYSNALRPFTSGHGSVIVWCAAAALTGAPWPAFVGKLGRDQAARDERARAQQEWETREQTRRRAENLAKIQTMTADRPLMDWYDLLDQHSGVSAEALEALRKVDRRQSDIEDMLSYGIVKAMVLLPDLDLKATPALCDAARTYMLKNSKEYRVKAKEDLREYVGDSYVENSLPGIRWLIAHGCDCSEGIAAMEASVQTFIDTPARKAALMALAELRHEPKAP